MRKRDLNNTLACLSPGIGLTLHTFECLEDECACATTELRLPLSHTQTENYEIYQLFSNPGVGF